MMKLLLIISFLSLLLSNCAEKKIIQPIGMTNPVSYFEIPVQDMERAIKFYTSVFGFEFEKTNIDGNEMAYFPQDKNGKGSSGALAKGETYNPSKNGTLIYFSSKNIEKTLVEVEKNNGKTLYPKTPIGDMGFVAEFEDSEGNKIALHQNK
jgi:uncharacterized protein